MLNPKLLNYLKELDLEPLWLHKKHISEFRALLQPVQKKKTSYHNVISQQDTNPIILSSKTNVALPHALQEQCITHHNLEINARSRFILTHKNQQTILIGFVNPTLYQKHHPLDNNNYANLCIELFKSLNLSYEKSAVFNKNELNHNIQHTDIHAIILFSQAFQSTKLLKELQQKKYPILILDHPYYILRNPLVKKEIWLKLIQFLNI